MEYSISILRLENKKISRESDIKRVSYTIS